MRANFDRSFAEPFAISTNAEENLLAIRIGADPFALRLSEISMIEADRPLTAVPSDSPELLGVAGLRRSVVAVYDLALLMGLPRAREPRWLVRAKATDLAFAFSALEGQIKLEARAISHSASGSHTLARDVARIEGTSRPIIALSLLVRVLAERTRPIREAKENSSV